MLVPADIRFPLERANGVQIVKTAAALAARGRAHDAARARTATRGRPPRSWPSTAWRRSPACACGGLRVRPPPRARSRCRALRFLGRARPRRAWPRCAAARVVFTRDLQLADLLLRAARGAGPRGVRGARGGGAHVPASAARLYGTGEAADPRKAARLRRARGAGVAAAPAASWPPPPGIRDTLHRGVRARGARVARDPERLRRARGPRVPRPRRRRRRRASSTRASSIRGRASTCWWRPWRGARRRGS